MRIWRVCVQAHAAQAYSGGGGVLHGARWNRKGTRIVYAAQSLSLAALEYFVNLAVRDLEVRLVAVPAEIPETVQIRRLEVRDLPPDWKDNPIPESTQRLGTEWVLSQESAVLSVPSVVIPSEWNYLLNPAHAEFASIKIGRPEPFSFDPRLWGPATRRRV